ncbi:hypothetical protein [Shewanella halifaxensis]|uniref:hypothetical protein n=1 Tax=Shewanella halifaxensis TaxID=271098 RepID=UPI000D5984F3|nr:hypothetical protein [Shewanella halifaxensis]
MKRYLFLVSALAFSQTASAIDIELKQKVKLRDSVDVRSSSIADDGSLNESVKKKQRTSYQAKLLFSFDPEFYGLNPYLHLGYEWEDKTVDHTVADLDKSYHEKHVNQFIGIGVKYKAKQLLGAEQIKFDWRFERWFDVDVERHHLAPDASDLSGNFDGYEAKFKIEAVYATPWQQWIVEPRIDYSYAFQDDWLDKSGSNEVQVSERGHEVEARLLMTYIVPSALPLTLSLGPEWVYEYGSEKDPVLGWQSENDDVMLATFMATFELPNQGLEFEFWANHQLDGELQGENNFELKMDWKF